MGLREFLLARRGTQEVAIGNDKMYFKICAYKFQEEEKKEKKERETFSSLKERRMDVCWLDK